jgi:Vitamin K epoxide reductase family
MLPLAAAGLLIAGYLTLVQLDVLAPAWDPLFGTPSTQRVLELTHPVPDAAAGVIAYATEIVLLLTRRGRLVLGVVLAAGAITSIVLIVIQPIVVGAWCALCLASATLSLGLLLLGHRETIDALIALAFLLTPARTKDLSRAGTEHDQRADKTPDDAASHPQRRPPVSPAATQRDAGAHH